MVPIGLIAVLVYDFLAPIETIGGHMVTTMRFPGG